MTIALLSGVARPSRAMRRRMGILEKNVGAMPKDLSVLVDNAEAIDALARLLTEAIEKRQSKDGRIDMRDVAAHVIGEMKNHVR